MSEDGSGAAGSDATDTGADAEPTMDAAKYPDGSLTYPAHPVGPGGEEPVGTGSGSSRRSERLAVPFGKSFQRSKGGPGRITTLALWFAASLPLAPLARSRQTAPLVRLLRLTVPRS